jgi:uncharacterized protein YndB with AHSA1/START domain
MILRVFLWVAVVAAAIVAVMALIGWMLPVAHRASRSTTVPAPRESVYTLVSDVERFPRWRSRLSSVELLPPIDGRPRFREIGKDGAITYVVDASIPGERHVTRIADSSLPFGGRWTFELEPSANGTTLRITEDGEVYNPIFRFVSRFVMGHASTIDGYLRDVEKHFGGLGAG